MKEQSTETLVGAVVALVAAGFLSYAVLRAGAGEGGGGGYPLVAQFDRVNGIAVGSDVRMSGVKVGAVSNVSLDPETYRARVTLNLRRSIKVPEDSSARITSDGLLGGAYIGVEPGGSADMLAAGEEIAQTQGSVDLLTLLSTFAQSTAGGGQAQSQPQSLDEGYPE